VPCPGGVIKSGVPSTPGRRHPRLIQASGYHARSRSAPSSDAAPVLRRASAGTRPAARKVRGHPTARAGVPCRNFYVDCGRVGVNDNRGQPSCGDTHPTSSETRHDARLPRLAGTDATGSARSGAGGYHAGTSHESAWLPVPTFRAAPLGHQGLAVRRTRQLVRLRRRIASYEVGFRFFLRGRVKT
jgi:hypothetical protein